jgi:hypothetical protein
MASNYPSSSGSRGRSESRHSGMSVKKEPVDTDFRQKAVKREYDFVKNEPKDDYKSDYDDADFKFKPDPDGKNTI